jgi:hypothetical protein
MFFKGRKESTEHRINEPLEVMKEILLEKDQDQEDDAHL